jgi:hypothetical protein
MGHAKPYFITPAFAFVAYPNRDSTIFQRILQYPRSRDGDKRDTEVSGIPEFIKTLVQMGWLDSEPKDWLKEGITWARATQTAWGRHDASER